MKHDDDDLCSVKAPKPIDFSDLDSFTFGEGDDSCNSEIQQLITRVDDTSTFAIVTNKLYRQRLHSYKDRDGFWKYHHCNGSDCNACKGNKRPRDYAIIPVIDLDDGVLKYLQLHVSLQDKTSVSSQLFSLMKSGNCGAGRCVEMTRMSQHSYSVKLAEGLESCVDNDAIKSAQELIDEGSFLARTTIPRLTNDEILFEVPGIRKRLEMRGLI